MITQKKYLELLDKWDVVIPPYSVEPVEARSLSETVDWGHTLLKAGQVYDKTKGRGVAIAILDTAGTFKHHPDLQPHSLESFGRDFTGSGMQDAHGHGTHCAGIAAAVQNGIGVLGIAPEARLIPVKVLNDSGAGSYNWIAAGIRYIADLHIPYTKIISMSLGGSRGSTILHDAIKYAIAKGVFIFAAAGNSYKEGQDTVGYPGAYPEVICVGSIGRTKQPSRFSSAGPDVDVVGPGESVLSTYKDGTYARLSGTSMATPMIAGVGALLLSYNKEIKSQRALEVILTEHADDLYDTGKDDRTGWGLPVVPNVIDANPVPEDPPPPPTTPAPDPKPDPDPLPVRTHLFDIDQEYSMYWRTFEQSKSAVLNVLVTVEYEHTQTFGDAVERAVAITAGWFQNRGLILANGSDEIDAAKWTAYFYTLMNRGAGLRCKEISIVLNDITYRVESLDRSVSQREATIKNAITYQY